MSKKKCLNCLILIGFVYIIMIFISSYQMRQIRKMIPKFQIGDIFIDDIYEGFSDTQLAQCIYHMNFFKNLTIATFLGTEENNSIPDYCKRHHNTAYEKISVAINKLKSKNEECNLVNEYKNGINYFYCEFKYNDSYFENIIRNNLYDKNQTNYDDEIEQYYIKSRKDCVEYGLKSQKEEIIVCTRYE